MRTYPFVRLTEASSALRGGRRAGDRLRHRRAARGDARRSSARRSSAALDPLSTYPQAEGLPELRAAIAAWAGAPVRRAAGPGPRGDPDVRLQGGGVPPRAGARRRPRGRPAARVPRVRARRRVRRQAGGRAAAARGAGFLPDLDAVAADVWARTAILWLNYPNNPTAATAPLELYERAAALAREHDFVRRVRRGVLGAVLRRRAAGLGAAGRRPHERRGVQHALQALVDAGLPLRLRRRRPGARRRAQALPAERRRRAAGVRPARRRGGVGRRGARRRRCATSTAPSATCSLPALEARGLRHAGGDATFFLWLEGAPPGAQERLLERGIILTPGDYFGAAGDGLPAAGARPDAGGVRSARAELLVGV